MPMNIDGFLPFTDFSLGLDLTSSPTGLDNRSLASALNVELTPQKGLTKRNGLKILEEGIQPVCFVGTSGTSHASNDSCIVNGKIYVCSNHRVSIFDAETLAFISYFGSSGTGDGQFKIPTSICSDGEYLFIADRWNHRIQKFTLSGEYVSKIGSQAGSGNDQFNHPLCVRYYDGKLYICDYANQRLKVHSASDLSFIENHSLNYSPVACWIDSENNKIIISADNAVFVHQFSNFELLKSRTSLPITIGVFQTGNYVYISDYQNHKIRRLNYSDLSDAGYYEPGQGSLPGQLNNPYHLNFWPEKNLILISNSGTPYYIVGITPELKFDPMQDTKIMDLYNYYSSYGNYIISNLEEDTNNKLWLHDGADWIDLELTLSKKRMSFITYKNNCYCSNGTDDNIKIVDKNTYSVGIEPPTNAPTLEEGADGNLNGRYSYIYVYKSSSFNIRSNPSPISSVLEVSNKRIKVNYVASTDPQVDKIEIYRTFALATGEIPVDFFLVATVNNETSYYVDDKLDSALGMIAEWDNYVPSSAKYLTIYKDRVFYANCPDEDYGESLVLYSKIGNADAIPAENYEYFDRGDGEEITGIAALQDVLIVFKESKFFTIYGDFELKRLTSSKYDVGNIAAGQIIALEDKVIFLSQNGWYSFNGNELTPISKTIAQKLIEMGYVKDGNKEYWSAAYLPNKNQIRFLATPPGLTPKFMVGTLLIPFLNLTEPISVFNFPAYVGWTEFSYPNHNLYCLAQYHKDDGTIGIMSGSDDGDIYLLDSESTDNGYAIPIEIQSGWFSFLERKSFTATVSNIIYLLRYAELNYFTDGEDNLEITFEINYSTEKYIYPLAGIIPVYCGDDIYCGETYCGAASNILLRKALSAGLTGGLFRFTISGNSSSNFILNGLTLFYRRKGVRLYR